MTTKGANLKMIDGKLLHIHTAARTGRSMVAHEERVASRAVGLEGDRYALGMGKYSNSPDYREITLFEIEVIHALKEDRGIDLMPADHRRNLTTQGIGLNHMIGKTLSIGEISVEVMRPCKPCRYLNLMSKKQISVALSDQAGVFARILTSGRIRIGDAINIC
jgi:MOSC domain-containing protein YiiM